MLVKDDIIATCKYIRRHKHELKKYVWDGDYRDENYVACQDQMLNICLDSIVKAADEAFDLYEKKDVTAYRKLFGIISKIDQIEKIISYPILSDTKVRIKTLSDKWLEELKISIFH